MDISLLLELPAWLEDECELDILSMSRDGNTTGMTEAVPSFLVIQSAGDRAHNQPQPGSPQPGLAGQSGRGASVVSSLLLKNLLKRNHVNLLINGYSLA